MWVLEDFAALAEKEGSELWEGLVFLWVCSLQLWDTRGVWGMDSAAVPAASKCPQLGRAEAIQKLPKRELGKLCKRDLILGEASFATGYFSSV